MKHVKTKTLYPILYLICALTGTLCVATMRTNPLSLLALPLLILAANVFCVAWAVGGVEKRTVRYVDPVSRFSGEEPKTVEAPVYRVNALPLFLSVAIALIYGIATQSPVNGLILLFQWGMLGYPLALSILHSTDFALSMQTGLISASAFTAVAGVIQVFLSSPSHTFQLKYCYDAFVAKIQNLTVSAMNEAIAIATEEGAIAADQFKDINVTELVNSAITSFVSILPALFAIVVLAALCLIWWLSKAALKRTNSTEIKNMGRLDGYAPSRVTSLLYLIFFFVYFFCEEGSGLQLTGLNVFYVISAVLAFAGFSFVLYMINTHAPSKGVRIVLTVGAILVSTSSCGGQLLVLAGLLSSGNDLRARFGGGTLK